MTKKYFDLTSMVLHKNGQIGYAATKPTALSELELDLVSGGYVGDVDPSTNDCGGGNLRDCAPSTNPRNCPNVGCP